MFHACKLVHADLSEYNILYHEDRLYIIDVSQSVEHDHPNAFNFLRTDLKNVEDFFGRNGVTVIGLRRSFEFVTKADSELELDPTELLKRWMDEPDPEEPIGHNLDSSVGALDGALQKTAREQDDAVFLQAYIPRTLNEVYDPERDIDLLKSGTGEKLIYEDTIGIVDRSGDKPAKPKGIHFEGGASHGSGSASEGDSGSESEGDEAGDFKTKKPRGHRHEDKDAKKVLRMYLSW
jgi:RIO kinase 1